MAYKALFLGSIGVVSETSDLQRKAFNIAFDRFGLPIQWDRATYADLVRIPGGRARIERAADAAGLSCMVDASAVYNVKQGAFATLARAHGAAGRAGVVDLLREARRQGLARALVSTTSEAQIDAALRATRDAVRRGDFDLVTSKSDVRRAKPAPDIYRHALATLGLEARDVLCIEDSPESAKAAQEAGLKTVAFPGAMSRNRAFPAGVPVVEFLSPSLLARAPAIMAAE